MAPVRTLARRAVYAAAAALVCALPAAATGGVSNGHSGWVWSDPSPQGQSLEDVSFAGQTGYASGVFGALLKSTDGGGTWTALPSRTTQDLLRVSTVGTTGLAASGECVVRTSNDAGATIGAVEVGGDEGDCGGLRVVAGGFADANSGLILLGDGTVLSTADGGVTTSRRTPVPGTPDDLLVLSPTTAFAVSGTGIYRTTDGAGSWTLVGTAPRTLKGITFATATVGYAVGDAGTVMKTIDGGATWTPAPGPGATLNLTTVRCATDQLCLMALGDKTVVRTVDGAATYSQVTPAAAEISAVAFASPTRAIAVGADGLIVVSDDGGATWRRIGSAFADRIDAVVALSRTSAYAVHDKEISLTGDGGSTWSTVGIPTSRSILQVSFADAQTGYVRDDGGTLRRTTNGGASWQVVDAGPGAGPLRDIVALTGGRVLLITRAGIVRSADGGASFRIVKDPVLTRSKVIRSGPRRTYAFGGRVFIWGEAGILRSTDGGRRWSEATLPVVRGKRVKLYDADCTASGACWIITPAGRFYRTTDFGRRWKVVPPAAGANLREVLSIAVAGPREAYLGFDRTPPLEELGTVLHTTDGGASWAIQTVDPNPSSVDVAGGRAWASTFNHVYTSVTGGQAGTPSTLSIRASARRFSGRKTITISGRLPGARGGERVALYASGFRPRIVTVASSGTFTARFRLSKTTTFVAQWAGDGVRAGDGTPALVVTRRS
jgi:photosystem II stability/assembly factor-like uncharacterized protein